MLWLIFKKKFRVAVQPDVDTSFQSSGQQQYCPQTIFCRVLELDNDPVHPVVHEWSGVHPPSRFQYSSDDVNGGQIFVPVSTVQIHYHPYSVAVLLNIGLADGFLHFAVIRPSSESRLS